MSSYVVDKKEFVKCAGLMHGIENAKRSKHIYFVDNVRNWFEQAYEMNVKSVNEQYRDNMQPDGLKYDTLFNQYSRKGESIYTSALFGENELKKIRPCIMSFFNSVLYQIENEDMHKEVAAMFYECTRKLFDKEVSCVDGWWTRIEV